MLTSGWQPCITPIVAVLWLSGCGGGLKTPTDLPKAADTVLHGGQVLTMDQQDRIVQAVAVRQGRIVAVGSDEQIDERIGPDTRVIDLEGRTVIPGIIAAHCHAVGVARRELEQPHAELLSIAEVQQWLRERAQQTPEGAWIRVPRTDITRIAERRHPTTAELDEATTSHPVIFTAARKHAINSRAVEVLGIEADQQQVPGGRLIRDDSGELQLIDGANRWLNEQIGRPEHQPDELRNKLRKVHAAYNAVGITSIFERAAGIDDYRLYQSLRDTGELTVRMTQTFRSRFNSAEDVERYVDELELTTGEGDDWVRVGPLKITVDGGIHWGNTYLSEPYGERRAAFYVHDDPEYRGDLNYEVDQMAEVFATGHRLGWQWCTHVTGDAGVDRVLDAIEKAADSEPGITKRRFSLTHAYFPTPDAAERAARLGVGVDTQASLYYKDGEAIAEIYGDAWAARFIGLGYWIDAGVPTAVAGDHMMGLDPDTAMNAFNPFLMLYVAVTRQTRDGNVYGSHQKLDRMQALHTMTTQPAHLAFMEQHKGSIEPGRFADLAVLDRDYLTCPEDQIKDIRVLMTMLDGEIVHATSPAF